jgi:hypothetical protein
MKLRDRFMNSIACEIENLLAQDRDCYSTIVLKDIPEDKEIVLDELLSSVIYDILEDFLLKYHLEEVDSKDEGIGE